MMRSSEKGVTLVELIVAVSLVSVILFLIWNYVNGAFLDSVDVGNKMIVEASVNQLMNNIQKHVQEASLPITTDSTDFVGESALIAENKIGVPGTLLIRKPGGIIVTYEFNNSEGIVRYEMKKGEEIIDSGKYEHISKFGVEFRPAKGADEEENKKIVTNGVKVNVVGRIDSKSNYSLTNEYYTRNTLIE